MTNYFDQKKAYIKWGVGIIFLVLILLFVNIQNSQVKNFFYKISDNTQNFFWRMGGNISGTFEGFFNVKNIKDQNDKLVLENRDFLIKVSSLEDLQKENETLRQALNLGLEKEFNLILVRAIGRDINGDFIFINKGFEDGISAGLSIIDEQKVLFGRVFEVFRNFSKVSLITEKDFAIDIRVQGKKIIGLVKGKGNISAYLDLIPKDSNLQRGDILVSSDMEGKFPKNLLVGIVKNVIKEDTKPFLSADIKPFFELNRSDILFVVLNSGKRVK